MIVGIDPGHGVRKKRNGPIDRGASSKYFQGDSVEDEADYTWHMAELLVEIGLFSGDHSIRPLIDFAQFGASITFAERGRYSKEAKCDLVISLHVNAANDRCVEGVRTFFWPGNDRGKNVCAAIQGHFPPELQPKKSVAPIAVNEKADPSNWLNRARNVLKPHSCTSILVEMGFLSNPDDAKALLQLPVQVGICAAILKGIEAFGGVTP